MAKLRLQLFGSMRIRLLADIEVSLRSHKVRALLAYLALNPDRRNVREKLATLLWPDRSDEQARHSLRQALLDLRQALKAADSSVLIAEGDQVALDQESVWVDVLEFERLAADPSPDAWHDAIQLYQGELLEGLRAKSDVFEGWVSGERIRLSTLAYDLMDRFAAHLLKTDASDRAIEVTQRMVALDPLREAGHRKLMRAYQAAGRRTAALKQYQICAETLRHELNVDPDPETAQLFARIRSLGSGAAVAHEAHSRDRHIATVPKDALVGEELGGTVRKLTTILSADMVGYSRLMEADEIGTIARQNLHRRELIDPRIAEHKGRIVKTTGDGLLVEFPSVVDAVQYAVEVQEAMAVREANVPEDRRIQYRCGINIGDIIVEGDDIFGDGVNIAARLEGLAEPGTVCVSGNVYDQIHTKLDFDYQDLGERQLKNISEPVRAYRVVVKATRAGANGATGVAHQAASADSRLSQWPPAAVRQRARVRTRPRGRGDLGRGVLRNRWAMMMMMAASLLVVAAALLVWQPWRSPPDGSFSAKPSIAVLPLRNLSSSPRQDYFGDAVTEGIIAALSRISKMFVVTGSSTLADKGRSVSPQEVAKRLGVQYVLEGSFQRTANKLRVTVRLTNAEGNVIWSDRYDRGVSDTFAVQDEIILRVITGLQIKLTEGEQERLSLVHGTTNLKAWEYAGQALLLLRRLKREDNARARKLYKLAATLDPNYPGALDGLAWTHVLDARFGWSASAEASVGQAAKIAQKAYALDPNRPRTYALLGHLQLFKGDMKQAIAFGEKSVALSPSGAENYALLAITYSYSGQPERSIELIERKAMKLSPLYPGYYLWILGRSYRLMGDHNRAVRTFTEHLKREPGSLVSTVELVTTYGEMGQFIEARKVAKDVLQIEPRFSLKIWERTLIYKDRAIAARELRVLRQAGLPE
ncbi:MAG: BTAD domain-containing putative transcriptional regulator [Alphaproteobacteria bacterium]|nr:BTAD domain-containing putative transcriptional regulator [Alphaproteobacteria bacterium]